MAAKKKKTRIIVRLQSTTSAYFKTAYKNPRMLGGHNGKLRKRMFDPTPGVRKHVWFEEKKVPK